MSIYRLHPPNTSDALSPRDVARRLAQSYSDVAVSRSAADDQNRRYLQTYFMLRGGSVEQPLTPEDEEVASVHAPGGSLLVRVALGEGPDHFVQFTARPRRHLELIFSQHVSRRVHKATASRLAEILGYSVERLDDD